MATRPLVSICIPSYNHARFLPMAIESALSQTYREIEIVIVDDSSEDESLRVALKYASEYPEKVRVLTHPGGFHRGISETANLAFRESRGELWSGLPSDDALYPWKIERQVEVLNREPGVGLVYGLAHVIDERGDKLPATIGRDISRDRCPLETLLHENVMPGVTALVRRECFEEVGLHNPSLLYSDWELWIRIIARWNLHFVNEPLAMWRKHSYNTSGLVRPSEDLAHKLQLFEILRQEERTVGGELNNPRVRRFIALQLANFRYLSGNEEGAAESIASLIRDDPLVQTDVDYLARWIRGHSPEFSYWILRQLPAITVHSVRWLGNMRLILTFIENLAGPTTIERIERLKRDLLSTRARRLKVHGSAKLDP